MSFCQYCFHVKGGAYTQAILFASESYAGFTKFAGLLGTVSMAIQACLNLQGFNFYIIAVNIATFIAGVFYDIWRQKTEYVHTNPSCELG